MPFRVLLVDDEPGILRGYRRVLERFFWVHGAANGSEGLEVLETGGPFSVIVADYCMPHMDGVQFLQQAAKADPFALRIMLTGKADLDMAIQAVNRGEIYRFLTKPCPSPVLLKTVFEAMDRFRAQQEKESRLQLYGPDQETQLAGARPGLARDHSRLEIAGLAPGDVSRHEGQKWLYQGLKYWEEKKGLPASRCFGQAREIFHHTSCTAEWARSCLYLARLGLQGDLGFQSTREELLAYAQEAVETIRRGGLLEVLHTEKSCAVPILEWLGSQGVETEFVAEMLQTLGHTEPRVDIYALGSLQLQRRGEAVPEKDWRHGKIKRLFLYLLAHMPRKTHRDVLLELFWADKDPDTAANNLSTSLYYLRQVLGTEAVLYQQGLCWLAPERLWCDASAFEQSLKIADYYRETGQPEQAVSFYQEAVSLYRGDFLEEYPYEDWLENERQRLQFLFSRGLVALAEIRAGSGRLAEAMEILGQAPLNRIHLQQVLPLLLHYLHHSGQEKKARATFGHYQRIYSEELGIDLGWEDITRLPAPG